MLLLRTELNTRRKFDFGQLGNLVLAPDFKFSPSWLYFYHASQADSSEPNLCSITKQKLILKNSDMVKFILLNTKITFHKLMFPKFFQWYETVTLSLPGLQKILGPI